MERNEALDIIRKNWPKDIQYTEALRTLIPELIESEDERILRSLKEGFAILNGDEEWYNGITNSEILTWLEKQGSQTLANSAKTCKVEPKFKIGDTIRPKGTCQEYKITEISFSEGYYKGEGWYLDIIAADDDYELVEQNHANKVKPKFKVGDRIYDKRDSYNRNVIREVGEDYYINAFGQKMDMTYTNANFEFIEHLEDDHISNKSDAWSEEDEEMKNVVKDVIVNLISTNESWGYLEDSLEWLKSLKDRYTWKPSDEQITELGKVVCQGQSLAVLNSLYNDLKKLRGE